MKLASTKALALTALGWLAMTAQPVWSTPHSYNIRAAPEAYEDGVINVHVVPHTHDDVGWLKTVDQYYYGANNSIQHAGVRYILDSVVQELEKHPSRRFTYVEMAFFARWFYDQTPAMQDRVRALVKAGQLDFVNGGWCMHDEATTHYVAMLDQTTLGHQFLKQELDFIPRVGWQIDPFGHSSTQASLLSWGVGFDALFFGRIDYQDRELRQDDKECEGVWRASPSLGDEAQVFWGLTGSYGGNYGPPSGYTFDQLNDDTIPVMDDRYLADYNVPARVAGFVEAAISQARQTKGNHIMFTMGSDFNYEAAQEWYDNMDKLIHYTNLDGRVRVFYSTPTAYMEAKQAENLEWGVKTDDFFPYADASNAYWTGYFTSRPALKRYERVTSGYLQAARQLETLSGQHGTRAFAASHSSSALRTLEAASGVNQHHDAVSGTSKQHVANDYAMRLANGVNKADRIVNRALAWMAGFLSTPTGKGDAPKPDAEQAGADAVTVTQCTLLNVSVCDVSQTASSQGQALTVIAYNPLTIARGEAITLAVDAAPSAILDASGEPVAFQVAPSSPLPGQASSALTVAFQSGDLAPLASATFTVQFDDEAETDTARAAGGPEAVAERVGLQPGSTATFTISNGLVNLTFSNATGRLVSMGYADDDGEASQDLSIDVDQGFYYYVGFNSSVPSSNEDASVAEGVDLGDCDPATWEGCPSDALYASNPEAVRRLKAFQERKFTPLELHADLGNLREASTQNSGAYIFRPQTPDMDPIPIGADDQGAALAVDVIVGDVVVEVRQQFADWVNQTIRLYKGEAHAELEWTVGPVPIEDMYGKEIVSRFSTSIASSDSSSGEPVCYTDSNGREFLERVKGSRPTWEVDIAEPVAGNYYPVNVGMYIKDDVSQLAVLTDRSQGGASLSEGDMELMVHRRLLVDDARGVGEPINETSFITSYADTDCSACREGGGLVVRGTHYLLLNRPDVAMKSLRSHASRVFNPLATGYTTSQLPEGSKPGVQSHGAEALPQNVQLITMQTISDTELFLRFENPFGADEDATLSQPVTVDVTAFLSSLGFTPVAALELTLTANQPLAQLQYLPWNTTEVTSSALGVKPSKARAKTLREPTLSSASGKNITLTLGPMEIRAIAVKLAT